MPAPPSTKQKAANQTAMNKAKANSNNFGGISTSTVKTSDRGSMNRYGANPAQRPSGGGLLAGGGGNNFGGINTGLLRSQTSAPSPLMQKAMDRNRANLLGQQYRQYRSPSSMDGAEDLSRAGFMADQYGQYRSPPPVNPMAPQAPMDRGLMDARINAVSRGPGSVAGVMPGAGPLSQQRTLLGLSGGLTGGGMSISPTDLQRLSATIAGEAGREGPMGQTAVGNTMLNRMALAAEGKAKYMGGANVDKLMGQYDATGMRPGTSPNKGFLNAKLGTDTLGSGIASIAGAASPNSQFNTTMPNSIKQATSFYNPDVSNPKWGGPQFTELGNHVFGLPDELAGKGAMVTAARGQPAAPTQVAGLSPAAAPPTPQVSETGPSLWESYAPDALQAAATSIDENLIQPTKEQIAKYGGLPNALRLSGLAVSVMNFLPGGKVDNSRYTDRTTESVKNSQNPVAAPPAAAPVVSPATPPARPPLPPQFYPQYSQMWANLPTGRV